MKRYFIIGAGATLLVLFAVMAFGILSQAHRNVYRSVVVNELPLDLSKFHARTKRLPLNWNEFVSWSGETHTDTHWSTYKLDDLFTLKWGGRVTPSDPQGEQIITALTQEFKGFEPTLNAHLKTLCAASNFDNKP